MTPYTTWTRKDRRIYHDSHCRICGDCYGICKGEPQAHRPAVCKACGTPQCWTHGLARGQCAVCYVGLLDAFSTRKCGYAHCGREAVAAAPRVGYACADHCKTAKHQARSVRSYIDARLAERERDWEPITFDMDAVPKL